MRNMSENYFEFGPAVQEMSFKDSSLVNSGGHYVWQSETV